eukprot:1160169-Pelagomonas_calceolata.AAC.4
MSRVQKGLGGEEGSHERCSLMTCSKAIKGYARGQHEMMCSSAAIEGVYSVQCVHFKVRRKGQHGVASSFKGPSCPGAHIPINIGSPVQDDACQLACVLALCACAQVNIGSPVQDDASRSIPPEATPTSVKELRARVEAVQHERALEADTKAAGRDDERGSRGSSKEGGGDGSQKVGENGDVDGEDETPQEAGPMGANKPPDIVQLPQQQALQQAQQASVSPDAPAAAGLRSSAAAAAAPAAPLVSAADVVGAAHAAEPTELSFSQPAGADAQEASAEPRREGLGRGVPLAGGDSTQGAGQKLAEAGSDTLRASAAAPALAAAAAAAAPPRVGEHEVTGEEGTSSVEPQEQPKQLPQPQLQQQEDVRQGVQSTPQASRTPGPRREEEKNMEGMPQAPPATPSSSHTSRVQMLKVCGAMSGKV